MEVSRRAASPGLLSSAAGSPNNTPQEITQVSLGPARSLGGSDHKDLQGHTTDMLMASLGQGP